MSPRIDWCAVMSNTTKNKKICCYEEWFKILNISVHRSSNSVRTSALDIYLKIKLWKTINHWSENLKKAKTFLFCFLSLLEQFFLWVFPFSHNIWRFLLVASLTKSHYSNFESYTLLWMYRKGNVNYSSAKHHCMFLVSLKVNFDCNARY